MIQTLSKQYKTSIASHLFTKKVCKQIVCNIFRRVISKYVQNDIVVHSMCCLNN